MDTSGIIITIIIITAVILILQLIGSYLCFEKAGIEGWKAIIPLYNRYQYGMIATGDSDLSVKYLVLSIAGPILNLFMRAVPLDFYAVALIIGLIGIGVSIASLVVSFRLAFAYARAFGRSDLFAWGYFFFPTIFDLILAFDKTVVYSGPLSDKGKNTFTYQNNTADNYTFTYSESADNINTTRITENISATARKDTAFTPVQPDADNKPDHWDWFFK